MDIIKREQKYMKGVEFLDKEKHTSRGEQAHLSD
jgi:hypothetical protein